jgi:hypothetical protein
LPAVTETATATETALSTATVETTKIKTIVGEGSQLAKTGLDWPVWVWWLIALGLVGGTGLVIWSKFGYKRKH